MTTKNTLFTIEEYILSDEQIEVFTDKKYYLLDREKFEAWLKSDDRINTELNYSDETGSHVQECGQMTMEEYWGSERKGIEQDLYDYIVLTRESENAFDIFSALGKIFNPKNLSNAK